MQYQSVRKDISMSTRQDSTQSNATRKIIHVHYRSSGSETETMCGLKISESDTINWWVDPQKVGTRKMVDCKRCKEEFKKTPA